MTYSSEESQPTAPAPAYPPGNKPAPVPAPAPEEKVESGRPQSGSPDTKQWNEANAKEA